MLNREEFIERIRAVKVPSRLIFDDFETAMEDLTNKGIVSTLHRLNDPMGVIVAGDTNVGKTAILKHLFIDEVGSERYGEFFKKNIKSDLYPDVTRRISQLPLGRVDNPRTQGIVLYDTPGLGSDFDDVDNTARVALGMEQKEPKLREVDFDFYSLPEALNEPAKFDRKKIPIEEVPNILNDRSLTCLYVVDGAAYQLNPEQLQKTVAWLREQYEGKVIFAKTFRDKLETWPNTPMEEGGKGRRDSRYEVLDAILGKDAVWVNGLTGEGIDRLAYALLKHHGFQGAIAPHLSVELKCQRLLSASQQIPGVIIPAFFSQAFAERAETALSSLLSFLAGFLIYLVYSEDPSNDPEIQAFEEKAKEFTDALKESEVEEKQVLRYRPDTGFLGILMRMSFFPPSNLRYINVTELSRTPEVLAQFYYWIYTVIYDRENLEDASVIEGLMVPEAEGRQWFVDQFKPHEELFLSNSDSWKFYQAIGADALTKFFETHHPEVLPVYKQTDLAKDEDEASTE